MRKPSSKLEEIKGCQRFLSSSENGRPGRVQEALVL